MNTGTLLTIYAVAVIMLSKTPNTMHSTRKRIGFPPACKVMFPAMMAERIIVAPPEKSNLPFLNCR